MLKTECVEYVDLFDASLGLEYRYLCTSLNFEKYRAPNLWLEAHARLHFWAEMPFLLRGAPLRLFGSAPSITAGKTVQTHGFYSPQTFCDVVEDELEIFRRNPVPTGVPLISITKVTASNLCCANI